MKCFDGSLASLLSFIERIFARLSTVTALESQRAMALIYYALAFIAALFLIHQLLSLSHSRFPFPKGPKPTLFLGNLHQVPLNKAFITFKTWSHSPTTSSRDGLVGLRIGPSARTVILNKWTHVRDLFDSREKGAIYSDRPCIPAADHVLPNPPGADLHLAFARYGPKWRQQRKTITEFMSERQLDKISGVQDAESTQMMWEFLQFCGGGTGQDLKAYDKYVGRAFGAVILETVYGLRSKESDENSRIMRFFSVTEQWASIVAPGATPPTDLFPWLRFVPDMLTPWKGWKDRTADVKRRQRGLYVELFADAEKMVKAGKAQESFVARLLREQETAIQSDREKDAYTRLELEHICGFLIEAGADTTVMAFETFILAMATNPEVQRQAQAEVDAVFGPDQMPHKIDGAKVPFLKACFLEVSTRVLNLLIHLSQQHLLT